MRTLALALLALALAGGVFASCSTPQHNNPAPIASQTPEPSSTPTPTATAVPTPTQTLVPTATPTATSTATATATRTPSPTPTIQEVKVDWELIGPPGAVLHRVFAEQESYSLYALQYAWRDMPQEFWASNDGGDSWNRVAEIPPGPGQLDDDLRKVVTQIIQSVIPKDHVGNPKIIKIVSSVAQGCDALFADVDVPLEFTQQLFVLRGNMRLQLVPPEPLQMGAVFSPAILCNQEETYLYFVHLGKLWRTTLSSLP